MSRELQYDQLMQSPSCLSPKSGQPPTPRPELRLQWDNEAKEKRMTTSQKAQIEFLLWNVNGLRMRHRREKILQYLKDAPAQIIILQETHLTSNEMREVFKSRKWLQKVVFTDHQLTI